MFYVSRAHELFLTTDDDIGKTSLLPISQASLDKKEILDKKWSIWLIENTAY